MSDNLTYEEIYELLMKEKNSTDLQALDEKTLEKIRNYFASKDDLASKQKESTGFFNSKKQERIASEINNAKRALKDLYEKRERKIINRALFSVRTNSKVKDTTNMTNNEIKLYKNLIVELQNSNKEFFDNLSNKKPKELKAKFQSKNMLIRLTDNIPELTDTKLNKYGPFEAEDVANLPDELADLLISQKKAIKIKDEGSKTS